MKPDVGAPNAYAILGVSPEADFAAVQQAFRNLARKYHPDVMPLEAKEEAARIFARINRAYELLRNADRRRRYDTMLRRDIIPDLEKEIGDVPLPSLAKILGQIQALNIEAKPASLNSDDWKLLEPSLIRGEDFSETVVDCLGISRLRALGFVPPPEPGVLEKLQGPGYRVAPTSDTEFLRGSLVVTEMRLTILMTFSHYYKAIPDGALGRLGQNTPLVWFQRMVSFPYPSLKTMEVHEMGRISRSYDLVLEDEEGTRFMLTLQKPQLTRLFLVANTYRLPLKVRIVPSCLREVGIALLCACAPVLVWFAPFLIGMVLYLFTLTSSSSFSEREEKEALKRKEAIPTMSTDQLWFMLGGNVDKTESSRSNPTWTPMVLELLNRYNITALAFYLSPLFWVFFSVRFYRAWRVGQAGEVFGPLPVDYAAGVPDLKQVWKEPSPFSPEPPRRESVPQPEQEPAPAPVSEGPADVEMPEAVREALRREKPPE